MLCSPCSRKLFLRRSLCPSCTPTALTPVVFGLYLPGRVGGEVTAGPHAREILVISLRAYHRSVVAAVFKLGLAEREALFTADALKLALATGSYAGTKSPSTEMSNNYNKITTANSIADSDYLTNVTWVGTLSGSNLPVIIVLKNALCTNGLSLTTADKAEGVVTLTLTGHYDPSNLDDPPFEIYYPILST